MVWALVVALPTSLLGQNPSAILHAQGGVWVNGYEAKDSSAIFTGDLVETKPEFSANLSLDGSTVLIQPVAVAKLQENMLVLDHGSVSVGTSKSFKLQVKCITVAPVSSEWTQYDVTDVNGTIQVAGRKNDVYVQRETNLPKQSAETAASHEGLLHEGGQRSYDESQVCGSPPQPGGIGPALNSKWAVAGAGVGIVVLICVLVCTGREPISPDSP